MTPVDVTDLLDRPGQSKVLALDTPLEGLRVALAEVPADRPVHAALRLEGVSEGILVSGRLSADVRLTCARCLTPLEGAVETEVQELFVPDPGPEGEAEGYPLGEPEAVDLEPMVRDAVVLALPFAPLCRPECQGLCERCGGDRNIGSCTCTDEVTDPRWAVLSELTFDEEDEHTEEEG